MDFDVLALISAIQYISLLITTIMEPNVPTGQALIQVVQHLYTRTHDMDSSSLQSVPPMSRTITDPSLSVNRFNGTPLKGIRHSSQRNLFSRFRTIYDSFLVQTTMVGSDV